MNRLFIHHKLILLPAITLVISGCTVGPDFVKPEIEAPPEWSQRVEQGLETTPNELVEWWRVFEDPVLNELVDTARLHNNTLEIAGIRVLVDNGRDLDELLAEARRTASLVIVSASAAAAMTMTTTTMMTSAMRAASRPYSMAVAPSSRLRTRTMRSSTAGATSGDHCSSPTTSETATVANWSSARLEMEPG